MKNRMKAEVWDKAQYMLTCCYDRMMHAAIYFDGHLDLTVMRKALKKITSEVEVLRATYHPAFVREYWTINDNIPDEEMCEMVSADNLKDAVETFLKGYIPHDSKLQFRAAIFENKKQCAFALLVNHQCFDGNELRYILKKLVECYNSILNTGNADAIKIRNGSRATKQLYDKMDENKRKKAKKLYTNSSIVHIKSHFKWTDKEPVSKKLMTRSLDSDLFDKIKTKGKEHDATINDVLLAAYFRAYAKQIGASNDHTLSITNIIDLRRHLKDGQELDGCTNMVSIMPTKLDGVGENFIETLKRVSESTSKLKQDELVGLYGIPLLSLGYKVFLFDGVARQIIKIFYSNSLMQMSNLGSFTEDELTFSGCKFSGILLTDGVKYLPYFQLTCVSVEKRMYLCIAQKCSDADAKNIERFLDDIVKMLEEFAKSLG